MYKIYENVDIVDIYTYDIKYYVIQMFRARDEFPLLID